MGGLTVEEQNLLPQWNISWIRLEEGGRDGTSSCSIGMSSA